MFDVNKVKSELLAYEGSSLLESSSEACGRFVRDKLEFHLAVHIPTLNNCLLNCLKSFFKSVWLNLFPR